MAGVGVMGIQNHQCEIARKLGSPVQIYKEGHKRKKGKYANYMQRLSF
jgi:hypothetical protein